MKPFLAFLLFLCAIPARSQTLLVGAAGGDSFNNASIGPMASAVLPFARRFEADPSFSIYPECKQGYGCGWGTIVKAEGIVWLSPKFGAESQIEYGHYSVTQAAKSAVYFSAGAVFRAYPFGVPTRFTLGYLQQIHNGISSGTETNHVLGARFKVESRIACAGPACFRISDDFVVGHVLNQGNPVCDGTFPLTTLPSCPRSGTVDGGVTMAFTVEFPRRKGQDNNLF